MEVVAQAPTHTSRVMFTQLRAPRAPIHLDCPGGPLHPLFGIQEHPGAARPGGALACGALDPAVRFQTWILAGFPRRPPISQALN